VLGLFISYLQYFERQEHEKKINLLEKYQARFLEEARIFKKIWLIQRLGPSIII
jgi:hypothetical protein